ncbi:hypothetical protein C1H46_006248 [Malus baccata]|uniref:SAM-dependent MTase RsmB/NOP-type domain-containing protein n=1 Tax=Malus baccata TaxID=106549 RepID=A0A540NAQ1_MALBA|nr:hypothetical protein C1H46_006248 [Malus baccata]
MGIWSQHITFCKTKDWFINGYADLLDDKHYLADLTRLVHVTTAQDKHYLSSIQGMVYAVDINEGRLRILKETTKLHQVDDVITIVHSDIRTFSDNNSTKCDKLLLDAPCSGLGVLSKRARLHWNRKLEDMEQLKSSCSKDP